MSIEAFTTPITSGLTPAAGGTLSRRRAELLAKQLRRLRVARLRAGAEIRVYPVGRT